MFVPLQSHSENIQKNPKESAEIAQLVEHNLAKVGVASSSLVFRSKRVSRNADLNFAKPDVVQLYAGRPLLRSAFFFSGHIPAIISSNHAAKPF